MLRLNQKQGRRVVPQSCDVKGACYDPAVLKSLHEERKKLMEIKDKDRAYLLTLYDDSGEFCTPILHQFKMQTPAQRKKHRTFRDNIADMRDAGTNFLLSLVMIAGGDVEVFEEDDPRTIREDIEDEMCYMKDGLDGLYSSISSIVIDVESCTTDLQGLENDVLSLT